MSELSKENQDWLDNNLWHTQGCDMPSSVVIPKILDMQSQLNTANERIKELEKVVAEIKQVALDTGNLIDDPLYKAIDALYNRGWTDYHRKNKHDPRGTREWQSILDMFRLQKRQLESKDT